MSPAMLPATVPRLERERVVELLRAEHVVEKVAILGVRGYYRRTMGNPDANDFGLYDDAMFVVSPDTFTSFNANTDPSRQFEGVAVLEPGLYTYRQGIHGLNKAKDKQYTALTQASEVRVRRPGTELFPKGRKNAKYGRSLGGGLWAGWFGINHHRGGKQNTSSLGCQTLPPEQWPAYIALVLSEMKRHGVKHVPYLLLDGVP